MIQRTEQKRRGQLTGVRVWGHRRRGAVLETDGGVFLLVGVGDGIADDAQRRTRSWERERDQREGSEVLYHAGISDVLWRNGGLRRQNKTAWRLLWFSSGRRKEEKEEGNKVCIIVGPFGLWKEWGVGNVRAVVGAGVSARGWGRP
jgi:hypothetical protein